ncbi:MAG: hypothetical protein GX660_13045, partial [Clostridiaceae bacterium]|nr:hypothetical protein [Clostridiaceae bacterium]
MNKLLCSWVFSILVINLVLFNAFADEKNLAYNSSFEEVLEEIPLYWYIWTFDQSPGASEFKVEKGPGLNGNNCAVIVNNKPNDARLIQNIEVKQNSKYK